MLQKHRFIAKLHCNDIDAFLDNTVQYIPTGTWLMHCDIQWRGPQPDAKLKFKICG